MHNSDSIKEEVRLINGHLLCILEKGEAVYALNYKEKQILRLQFDLILRKANRVIQNLEIRYPNYDFDDMPIEKRLDLGFAFSSLFLVAAKNMRSGMGDNSSIWPIRIEDYDANSILHQRIRNYNIVDFNFEDVLHKSQLHQSFVEHLKRIKNGAEYLCKIEFQDSISFEKKVELRLSLNELINHAQLGLFTIAKYYYDRTNPDTHFFYPMDFNKIKGTRSASIAYKFWPYRYDIDSFSFIFQEHLERKLEEKAKEIMVGR